MPSPQRARVVGFVWRFGAAYVCILALWLGGLERRYDDVLATVSRALLIRGEEPRLTRDVERYDRGLVVRPVSALAMVPPQEIVTRRVHSNTAFFAALTLATPGIHASTRMLWLAGGGILLAGSHVAHVVAYVHHHYALYNVGPYYTPIAADRLWQRGWKELSKRPAARLRALRLLTADLFNIVLQRVVPIALWLPLFLAGRSGARVHRSVGRWPAVALLVVVALAVATSWGERRQGPVANAVENVRLGSSAVAAKLGLEARGYEWTLREAGLHDALIDVWPRHGPLTDARYGPRFNWIGIRIAQPDDAPPTVATACITGLVTAPSDAQPSRVQLEADAAAVCRDHWAAARAPVPSVVSFPE